VAARHAGGGGKLGTVQPLLLLQGRGPVDVRNLSFLNGAFAEYIVVPARIVGQNLYEIPEGVEYSRAALLEPLACAVHGIVRTLISMGDTVAVIGAGQIGLMFVRLATERGARVICVDKSSDRLAVARELGAGETVEAAEGVDTIEAVREWTPASRGRTG